MVQSWRLCSLGTIDIVILQNIRIQNVRQDTYRDMEKKIIAKKILIVLASGVGTYYGINLLYRLVNKILVRSLVSNSNEVIIRWCIRRAWWSIIKVLFWYKESLMFLTFNIVMIYVQEVTPLAFIIIDVIFLFLFIISPFIELFHVKLFLSS
jgi:hypothetical protein